MATQIQLIKQRLYTWNQPYISAELLSSMLTSLQSKYSIGELVRRKIVLPIKQGKIYINMQSTQKKDVWTIGSLYFDEYPYVYGGLCMANRYGMSTQMPEWYTIYNTLRSGKKIIAGNYKYIFKEVSPSFFYGIKKEKRNGYTIHIMTPERLLIQMIKEGSSLEFVQELPSRVNKKRLFAMGEKHVSKRILSRLHDLYA